MGISIPAGLTGLTSAEVAERTAAGQANETATPPSRTVTEILRANLLTRFNAILGALLLVILVVGPFQDALFGIVLVTNIIIGVIQEIRAKITLDRLAVLAAPRVTAVRDGRAVELAVDEVVLDDVLRLEPGDQVVVDGTVVASEGLEVDESLLTGEADPEAKGVGGELLSGSFAAAGTGWYRAMKVGGETYAAALARQARRFSLVHSELRAGTDLILRYVTWLIIPTAILLISSQLLHNDDLPDAIRGSVAGVGSMIPEGLVLLTSLAMAVGVIRLGRRKVLVQELPAVEALARVDVVCLDKTGTLTEGSMAVSDVKILGPQDATATDALGAMAGHDPSPNASMRAIAARFAAPEGWRPDRMVPFSSARKWSAASFGGNGSWVLGAPEVLLESAVAGDVSSEVEARAAAGKRVLLLARSPSSLDGQVLPGGLEPAALVSLQDCIRPEAAGTLQYFARENVALKVLSGDDPKTVGVIAGQLGMADAGSAVDARRLPDDAEALADIMEKGTVFGRVSPHQKEEMVRALQSRGHVVAMAGDGVNDVLALKRADVGVALASGSGAARAVSQVVLLDDNFDSLPAVVGEGRRVIGNVERVANLFLTKTVYATLLALAVGVARFPFPFLPRQLTVITALTIGTPAFLLALAPNASRARPGFVSRVLAFAIPAGMVAATTTFVAYALVRAEGISLDETRTTATMVLLAIGFWVLTVVARPLTRPRRWLLRAMAAAFVVVLVTPPLRDFYALSLPPLIGWLTAIFIAGIAIVALELGWQVAERWRDQTSLDTKVERRR